MKPMPCGHPSTDWDSIYMCLICDRKMLSELKANLYRLSCAVTDKTTRIKRLEKEIERLKALA